LVVLPSYSENFGNVVLEAMAAACPVIVTPEVGLADVVRESGAGLVSDGEPNKLAQAIVRMLADPELRNRAGEAGRMVAIERFSWHAIADATVSLYQEIIQSAEHCRLEQDRA
jgi:glycosyltransferase involved in cell wall biosynthesis